MSGLQQPFRPTLGRFPARDVRIRPQAGFGTFELLVTLVVVLAIAAIVVPGAATTLRTYKRSGGARQVLAAIRATQSEAVTRGAVIGFQWGADPLVGLPTSQYRIVRDTTGSCSFPAADAIEDGTNVITTWRDLEDDFPGVTILSIRDAANNDLNGVMFNAFGASVNSCASVSFPVTVSVADASGTTHSIAIRGAGGATLQ